jgi:hypothetical protein
MILKASTGDLGTCFAPVRVPDPGETPDPGLEGLIA